jgi:hypothetical protein
MPTRSEMLGNRPIGGEAALRGPGRLAPLHAPLPLPGRLMGVLRPVVEIPMLAVFHARQDRPLGGPIAFEFIRANHARDVRQSLEELPEDLLGRLFIPPPRHQDVEHIAVLIHRTPEGVALTIDGQKHLSQMPRVAWPWAPATELIRVLLAELPTPLADGFV